MKSWSPFIVEELFAVNDFTANKITRHNVYGEVVVTYEDVFKYPHKIKEYLLTCPAPGWKYTPGIGKNFVEYWECRHDHSMHKIFEFYKIIEKIIYLTYYDSIQGDKIIVSNMFQWKKNPHLMNLPDCFGDQPHADNFNNAIYSQTTSFNDETDIMSTGVGFWKSKHGIFKRKQNINIPGEMKKADDQSYYNECPEKYWEIPPEVINHSFNKMVIYPSYIYHGAYHNKLDFIEYPRITIASFLQRKKNE